MDTYEIFTFPRPKSHFLGSNANPPFSYISDVGGEREREAQSEARDSSGRQREKEAKREGSIGAALV